MPTVVVKAEPDSDLYMVWSTVVDGPTAVGTRAEIAEYLSQFHSDTDDPEERLDRADKTGTSGMWPGAGQWSQRGFVCYWDVTGNEERDARWLPRANLAQWLRTGDDSLLEPIENDG